MRRRRLNFFSQSFGPKHTLLFLCGLRFTSFTSSSPFSSFSSLSLRLFLALQPLTAPTANDDDDTLLNQARLGPAALEGDSSSSQEGSSLAAARATAAPPIEKKRVCAIRGPIQMRKLSVAPLRENVRTCAGRF